MGASRIVLGIDPGTATTGFGLVEKIGHRLVHLAHGTIQTSPKLSDSQRLIEIAQKLKKIIQKNKPHQIAVEKLFFSKNVKTAMSVAQARGVILLTAASAEVETMEYSPNEIKLAVTGYGKADKSQVQKMVKTLLGMEDLPKPDDAADALATAICHLNQNSQLILKNKACHRDSEAQRNVELNPIQFGLCVLRAPACRQAGLCQNSPMIATLKGTVTVKTEDKIVLEVNNIGYEVHCPARSIASFEKGQSLFLHTYLSIKEDAHTLFGFESELEKKAFLLLLTVSGVGPKTAAQVISAAPVEILIKHVLRNDAAALSLIKGIGKKTAERIVLELKEKIAKTFGEAGIMNETSSSPSSVRVESFTALEDAQAALMALGYKFKEIQTVIDKNKSQIKDGMTTEDIVKVLLQNVK